MHAYVEQFYSMKFKKYISNGERLVALLIGLPFRK